MGIQQYVGILADFNELSFAVRLEMKEINKK
jgi:hypothetical protein